MNLYQHSQLATLQAHVDTDTGEIDIDSFDNAEIALQDKQQSVVCYLKNETVSISMIDAAIKDLTARKKSMQSAHDKLKEYLLNNMIHHGISEIEAADKTFLAKIKKNPPKLVIDDESLIPSEFMVTAPPQPPQLDKAAGKAELKLGDVSGVHLEQNQRLEIK
jgi:hypothetical protein